MQIWPQGSRCLVGPRHAVCLCVVGSIMALEATSCPRILGHAIGRQHWVERDAHCCVECGSPTALGGPGEKRAAPALLSLWPVSPRHTQPHPWHRHPSCFAHFCFTNSNCLAEAFLGCTAVLGPWVGRGRVLSGLAPGPVQVGCPPSLSRPSRCRVGLDRQRVGSRHGGRLSAGQCHCLPSSCLSGLWEASSVTSLEELHGWGARATRSLPERPSASWLWADGKLGASGGLAPQQPEPVGGLPGLWPCEQVAVLQASPAKGLVAPGSWGQNAGGPLGPLSGAASEGLCLVWGQRNSTLRHTPFPCFLGKSQEHWPLFPVTLHHVTSWFPIRG